MTTAVFAGGITLTSHPIACQAVSILWNSGTRIDNFKPSCANQGCVFVVSCVLVCFRWALLSTIPPCPLCCGSASAHGCSIRRPCAGLRGNQRARQQWCPLSGPCSGRWCHLGATRTCAGLVLTLTAAQTVPVFQFRYVLYILYCTRTCDEGCRDQTWLLLCLSVLWVRVLNHLNESVFIWEDIWSWEGTIWRHKAPFKDKHASARPPWHKTWLVKDHHCPSKNQEPSVSMEPASWEKESRKMCRTKWTGHKKWQEKP